MTKSSEQQQQKLLDILQYNKNFFQVFYYIKERLRKSKNFLLETIKLGAKNKFLKSRMNLADDDGTVETNQVNFSSLRSKKIYTSQKYDINSRYEALKNSWREDETNDLLKFLNDMCENCFLPAQNYIRKQIDDDHEGLVDKSSGKITSIDLIYQVIVIFIEVVDSLGDYVFSDFRTYKFIPNILDTIIEFIYGPNIEN